MMKLCDLFIFCFFSDIFNVKLLFAGIVLFLIVEADAQSCKFHTGAAEGQKHLHKKNVYNYNVIYPELWRIAGLVVCFSEFSHKFNKIMSVVLIRKL